jgi:hypothetical protein
MNKKVYQKPVVKKIKLEVKNSVLASCRTSPDPGSVLGNEGCTVFDPNTGTQCFNPF